MSKHQIILIFYGIFFLGLIVKAAQLQIFDRSYRDKAQRTTLTKKTIYPSRGVFYDRNDELLVLNSPIFNISATYNLIDQDLDTAKFCSLLDISKQNYKDLLDKDWRDYRYNKHSAFTFLSRVSPESMGKFSEHLHEFKGFETDTRNVRSYPHSSFGHTLGFIGEADKTDLESGDYDMGDFLGKTGLEKQYDKLIRGENGEHFVLRDNIGREVTAYESGANDKDPVSGYDIQTSLDIELQSYVESLLQGKRGSIVAIEPSTGEVLAMASAPNYDPNVLNIDSNRGEMFKSLMQDSINKPFLDRSLNAKYPPGSIFKPIISLIAMQEGVWNSRKLVSCPGYYQYRTFTYGCHGHSSPLSLGNALMHSCNSYFFQMLRDLVEIDSWSKPDIGLNLLNSHLNDFGLGVQTGIDLPGEKSGFLPSPEFYDRLYNDKYSSWKSTYIMSIGIGQGELEFTTLQIANLAVILANRGHFYTPHVAKALVSPEGNKEPLFFEKNEVRIDQKHFDPVIDGMRKVVKYGTGVTSAVPKVEIAGKTGTAQNPHGEDHSVFMAFAPIDDPKIAIAVFIENGGFGAEVAAPIAGLAIEKYLKGEVSPFKKPTELRMLNLNLIGK